MNISPVNTSAYSGVQRNNTTPSFGMAWSEASKEVYQGLVDNAVTNVFSKHGTQKGKLAQLGQFIQEKRTLGLADKIGKEIQDQDFLSNAHLRDFHLSPDARRLLRIDVAHLRTGAGAKTLFPPVPALKEGEVITEVGQLKALKKLLKTSRGYLNGLENGRISNNNNATAEMTRQIEAAKIDAQDWAAEQIATIRNQAGRDIARNIGDAHATRATKRINGNNINRMG